MGAKSNLVFLELLDDIDRGVYPLNTRLPTEKVLCERFEVSRNTVRKAIDALVKANKIDLKKNFGAIVTSPPKKEVHLKTISIMLSGARGLLNQIQPLVLSKQYIPNFFFQFTHQWDFSFEEQFLTQIMKQRHRALLAFCTPHNEDKTSELLQKLVDYDIRVVHMDIYSNLLPKENYILPDYIRAGRAAATSLMVAGCKNLYFCGFDDKSPVDPLILKGFLEVTGDQNCLDEKKQDIFTVKKGGNYFQFNEYGETGLEEDFDLFFSKLKNKPGVVCGTELRALKLIEVLQNHGVNVPEDIGVIGVEMMQECNDLEPKKVDCVVFDRLNAFKNIIDKVTQYHFDDIHELLPPRIVHCGTI